MMSRALKRKLKIAIIAPPWLSLYPGCYYGIENVVHHLAANLTKRGHHVELFSVGGTKTEVTKLHWYHKEDQYKHIHRPYHEVTSIPISHLLYSLNVIREAGDFDIIHDHNSFMGPAMLAYAADLPPILHTLHESFTDKHKLASGIPDNRLMFDQFRHIKNLYFNAVSYKQKSLAPDGLMPRIKGVIYNGVDPDEYIYPQEKEDYFVLISSVSPDKGQATAARAAHELGVKLKLAGTIGGSITTPEDLKRELADPKSSLLNDNYFLYFRDEVAPHLTDGQIEYIGKVTGRTQKLLFARAKAFVFPIDREEPFGIAVLDALASGTPVITYKRGAMPEIIKHGVNGFLANNYQELKMYMKRIDEIDPAACRRSVEKRFSTEILTDNYLALYQQIIEDHRRLIQTGQLYKNLRNILPLAHAKKIYGLAPTPKPKRQPNY